MAQQEFLVLVIRYKGGDKTEINKLVDSIAERIKDKQGEIRRVYQGSDEQIISALAKVLSIAP